MPSKIQTNTAKAVCVPSAGYGGQVKGACQGAWACLTLWFAHVHLALLLNS